MTVTHLPPFEPGAGWEQGPAESSSRMRDLTRAMALGQGGWTPAIAAEVRELFDELAPEWHTRVTAERFVPIKDALVRGGPFPNGLAVEVGSGTGIASPLLADHFPHLVALDLSMEMLRLAPTVSPRVRADASRLPFRDGSIAVLVLINMLLFPSEADRVLDGTGVLVWVNTSGPETPIYLSAEEVDDALPGDWEIVASTAARGTWCVARRRRS